MAYIDVIMRVFLTLTLSLILNKFLSIFRIRQLYVAYYDILKCREPGVKGFTVNLTVYNKGKEKEKSVEITIPDTKLCQILSSDRETLACEGNAIKIDRLLPRENVIISLFVHGDNLLNEKLKPSIRSEDTNGKSFLGTTNVPPSAGPAFALTSVFIALVLLFGYGVNSQEEIYAAYYSVRYSKLLENGISPVHYSDHQLLSKTSFRQEKYPIEYVGARKEENIIYLDFIVSNPLDSDILLTYSLWPKEPDYYSKILAIELMKDSPAKEAATREFKEQHYYIDPLVNSDHELKLQPKISKKIEVKIPIGKNLSTEDILVLFQAKGTVDGEEFSDTYKFSAEQSKQKDLLRSYIGG